MAADMLNTGLYGAQLADVQPGDTVVVMGVGPVGLMAIAGARLRVGLVHDLEHGGAAEGAVHEPAHGYASGSPARRPRSQSRASTNTSSA